MYSGINIDKHPHKQFVFSAAGLTTQALINEGILDIPHARGSSLERGILAGGIGTTLFYITLGRNGAVSDIALKDVILPGEIRELVNKVVEAERTAKANLIRRQEETAATRSLLNTAKLMEDNPLLLRLKELESIERLVEKVGRIDLHAGEGAGLDALLNKLVRLKADAPA